MARLEAFFRGRWGFVLTLAALAWIGGGYYHRVQVRDLGLKVFDRKGDKVLLLSPQDHRWVNQEMGRIIWTNVRRHPQLNDARFIVYVRKETVVDQFGRPPEMDIFLGEVFLPAGELEAFRQTPTLGEALSRWPVMYLDWEWVYQRRLVHLAADPVARPSIPAGKEWAVSLNWVLFNMLPLSGPDIRHTLRFGPGWADGPGLRSVSPGLKKIQSGPIGASPANPREELVLAYEFQRPWSEATLRDIHTAWEPNEVVGLEASVDGKTWRPVYRDPGGHKRRLLALKLGQAQAGGTGGERRLFLRYSFQILGSSSRSRDDLRGANLSFFDLAIDLAPEGGS